MNTVRIGLSVPSGNWHVALKRAAISQGLTVSGLIRTAVSEWADMHLEKGRELDELTAPWVPRRRTPVEYED